MQTQYEDINKIVQIMWLNIFKNVFMIHKIWSVVKVFLLPLWLESWSVYLIILGIRSIPSKILLTLSNKDEVSILKLVCTVTESVTAGPRIDAIWQLTIDSIGLEVEVLWRNILLIAALKISWPSGSCRFYLEYSEYGYCKVRWQKGYDCWKICLLNFSSSLVGLCIRLNFTLNRRLSLHYVSPRWSVSPLVLELFSRIVQL